MKIFIIINLTIGLINTILLLLIKPLLIKDFVNNSSEYKNFDLTIELNNREVSNILKIKQFLIILITNCIPILNMYRLITISLTGIMLLKY